MYLLYRINAEKKQLLACVMLLLVLSVLMLWRVVFRGDIYLAFDMLLAYEPWHSEVPGAPAWPLWNEKSADLLRIMYPVNLFIKEAWSQGMIPFWYPYAGLGLPALAEGIHQALYPVNLVGWWLFGLPEAIGWLTLLHLWLGGVFMLLFLRQLNAGYFGSLMAAIVFSYSSFLMIWLNLPFFLDTMIWLPLIFFGLERAIVRRDWRWTLVGIGALALQYLAGSLQLAVYGLTGLGFYALGRAWLIWRDGENIDGVVRPLLYFGLILVLGSGLAALQLLPTAELVSLGLVRGGVELDHQLSWGSLARLIAPDFIGTMLDGHNMSTLESEAYLYIGILPLFFMGASLFSRQAPLARLLTGVGLLFVLVIYSVPPFYQLFYYFYPTFTTLGFHRALYVVIFVWAAAAGIGADWILAARPSALLKWLVTAGIVTGLLMLAYTLWLAFAAKYQERFFWPVPSLPEAQPNMLYHLSTLIFALVFISAAVWVLWLWSHALISRQVLVSAATILLVLDLFLAHLDLNPALPKYIYDVSPPSLTFLNELVSRETEPLRVSNVGSVLKSNIAGLYHLPSIRSHDVFLLSRFDDYATLTGVKASGSSFREELFNAATSPLFNALNVKYIYANRADLVEGDWISVLQTIGQPTVTSDHADAGTVATWTINNWSQAVILAPAPTKLTYTGQLAYPAVFETAIAVNSQSDADSGVIFEVYVSESGRPAGQPAFSRTLTSSGISSEWVPVTVSLADFSGKSVEISLVTRSDDGSAATGGWADPLIYDGSKYQLIHYGPNSIYLNKNYLPRAWMVHSVAEVPAGDTAAAAALMSQPEINPATAAVVEGRLPAPPATPAAPATVRFAEYGPSASTIAVDTPAPGLLVLSDIYYPGWQATVDGVPQSIYAANLAMRGVFVPAGQHTIRFEYRANSFWLGLTISLTTLMIIGGAVLATFRRFRRRAN